MLRWPGRRLLVQRGDTELVALDLDAASAGGQLAEVRFPAPWPRRFGSVAVTPEGDAAVFAGAHTVRVVEATGATRWEMRHVCSAGECRPMHTSFAEYGGDEDHRYPDSGSAAVSGDGKLVWAHVRGPLSDDKEGADDQELWLVLDAADGRVLGRADTMTVASGSEQMPHPDPAQMGLSIGEGEEGSPVLWGRWDGQRLTVEHTGIERILLAVSPSGRHLLTVPLRQWSLSLHGRRTARSCGNWTPRALCRHSRGTPAGTGCTGTTRRPSWTRTTSSPAPPSATPGTARPATGSSTCAG
ncbi:hypothetical protein OG799_29950 [Micromonospora sp. NBC_00898]|uniref:hypothetical protein n=1 Tax=Micromonospora sp. NBC_00898 TaxID=2975981 RepID=UPI00386C186E|nr:hypothetical protein OG799_29950 [Micromonospora sp. NBC_00898]